MSLSLKIVDVEITQHHCGPVGRYTVAVWHGEGGSHGAVIDRKRNRVKGRASTREHGKAWISRLRALAWVLNSADKCWSN